MSATALVDGAATEGFNQAFTALQAKTAIAVVQSSVTPVTGDASLAGSAFITSIEKTGEIDSVITYNITFEGTGALTNTPAA
jgi:predicted secreted protein